MGIFFWDFKRDNDLMRQWIMVFVNFFVMIFTGFALFKTWRFYRQFMFEMIPLSINFIATVMLLFLKIFEKGYEFEQVSHLIEIFTYFLFCYTFAIMSTLIKNERKRKKVIWSVILLLMILALIILSVLVFTGFLSKKCGKIKDQIPAISGLVVEALAFIPTLIYGKKILKEMKLKEQTLEQENTQQYEDLFKREIYMRERKNQITIVIATFFVSIILRAFVTMFAVFMWNSLFECVQQQSSYYIRTSKQPFGQVILYLNQINELIPHIFIPIAMYVIPLRRAGNRKSFKFHDGFLDEQSDDFSSHDDVENKLQTILTQRMSEDHNRTVTRLSQTEGKS